MTSRQVINSNTVKSQVKLMDGSCEMLVRNSPYLDSPFAAFCPPHLHYYRYLCGQHLIPCLSYSTYKYGLIRKSQMCAARRVRSSVRVHLVQVSSMFEIK